MQDNQQKHEIVCRNVTALSGMQAPCASMQVGKKPRTAVGLRDTRCTLSHVWKIYGRTHILAF